jgi:hypothetical protein
VSVTGAIGGGLGFVHSEELAVASFALRGGLGCLGLRCRFRLRLGWRDLHRLLRCRGSRGWGLGLLAGRPRRFEGRCGLVDGCGLVGGAGGGGGGEGGDLLCGRLHDRREFRVGESDLVGRAVDPAGDGRARAVVSHGEVAARPDGVAPPFEDHLLAIFAAPAALGDHRPGVLERSSQTARSGNSSA